MDDDGDDYGANSSNRKVPKVATKLDSKSLGAVLNFKNDIDRNISGAVINGNQLQYPNKPFENKRDTDSAMR